MNEQITSAQAVKMHLQAWRGYSAYEIAVQNGFEGTQQEWLQSLQGMDGQTTSVNGVKQFDGNIELTGADLPVSAADTRRISELAALLDTLVSAVTVTEDGIDLGGRYLDNALFR